MSEDNKKKIEVPNFVVKLIKWFSLGKPDCKLFNIEQSKKPNIFHLHYACNFTIKDEKTSRYEALIILKIQLINDDLIFANIVTNLFNSVIGSDHELLKHSEELDININVFKSESDVLKNFKAINSQNNYHTEIIDIDGKFGIMHKHLISQLTIFSGMEVFLLLLRKFEDALKNLIYHITKQGIKYVSSPQILEEGNKTEKPKKEEEKDKTKPKKEIIEDFI